jgi:mono/diheme cytochrome c family protein
VRISTSFLALAALAIPVAVGCYSGAMVESDPGNAMTPAPRGSVGASSGLPCDVAEVVATSCATCHGQKPRGGAKTSLVTREGFLAASEKDPAKTVGALVVERMKDTVKPMPEDGLLAADKVAIVEKWVTAGMPMGECGAINAPADPFWDVVVDCSSGTRYTRGEGVTMEPGKACNACHIKEREKTFVLAGTVYPTGHESDRCNGVNGTVTGATIVATDLTGNVLATVPVNKAGNFASQTRITGPYKVKVVQNGKERVMKASPSSGDCNSCHTQDGLEGAPGRIALPQ